MKYTLKSEYGNIITSTESERQRDRLLALGYTLVEEAPEKQKNKPPKKEA